MKHRPDGRAGHPWGRTWTLMLVTFLALNGCEPGDPETGAVRPPQAIQAHEECHVCGMIITRFPGPKGEALVRRQPQALKFCSTRDLFAWLLQPESAALVEQVYVHDMSDTDWEHPEDTRLIDARQAWYVAGSTGRGAMGPTLASFATAAQAAAFAQSKGGRVLAYGEVTLELLGELE